MLATRIQSIQIQPMDFKLRQPFVTALGEKSVTRNVGVWIRLGDGAGGFGEGSASLSLPQETQEAMVKSIQDVVDAVRGKDIRDYRSLIATVWQVLPFHPTAAAAVECALLDAFTRTLEISLAQYFGGAKTQVETDLTVSAIELREAARWARRGWKHGFRTFKVKVGTGSVERDLQRLKAVHLAVPKGRILADANQGFGLTQAVAFVRAVQRARIPLLLLEQPVAKHDLGAMRTVRDRGRIRICADESVMNAADAARVLRARAADVINVKVAKSGLLGALDIIRVAQADKVELMIGCMAESKAGLAASVHLACGTGAFTWVDLDSSFLLAPVAGRGGFTQRGRKLSVGSVRRGIGIQIPR